MTQTKRVGLRDIRNKEWARLHLPLSVDTITREEPRTTSRFLNGQRWYQSSRSGLGVKAGQLGENGPASEHIESEMLVTLPHENVYDS